MQTSGVSSVSTTSGQFADTLPVNGSDAVEILLNDHQKIRALLTQLTSASDRATRATVLEQLKGALTIHNATEENLVYPAVRIVGKHLVESERLYHQTGEADVVVFELDSMLKGQLDEADFEEKAQALQDAVLAHMDLEENHAFQALREHASGEQTQTLTQSVRTFRKSLHFTPAQASG